MPAAIANRMERARKVMADAGLDVLVVTNVENLIYFNGLTRIGTPCCGRALPVRPSVPGWFPEKGPFLPILPPAPNEVHALILRALERAEGVLEPGVSSGRSMRRRREIMEPGVVIDLLLPTIYRKGIGGPGITDVIHVGESQNSVLTACPRDLVRK